MRAAEPVMTSGSRSKGSHRAASSAGPDGVVPTSGGVTATRWAGTCRDRPGSDGVQGYRATLPRFSSAAASVRTAAV